ncbi:uncharacterized protein LOC117652840 isoform X2 [Thrips palmi]|uniref:Uncharacterized protein LOC117652840 isoform X2 n=1 Tax=Thrips palmi TaxID=161013 RepID=A0A6P9A7I8_THRPL|nr:uncharacterized protein LOC117652840 isoform X2 [Thrips palmi]
MTETVKASQEDTQKDSTQQPSSPKTKSKAAKLSTEGNERPKSNDKVEKPPTKVVVRRLPPTMTLETFLDQVSPLPPVDYMYFVKADLSLTPNSFARAYLHFVHVADLLIFTEKFDNYVFVDSKGNEYPAIVEYAPFQRIPKQRSSRKKDPRIGTIGNDPYYLEFLEALKAEETQRKSASKTNKQHFFETSISAVTPKVTSTPLLEFLKARRADKLRTKEDKIAERRKREVERRKARDDARITVKHGKTAEADSDIAAPTSQIKLPQPSSDRTPDLAEIQTRYLRCMIGLDTDTSGLEKVSCSACCSNNLHAPHTCQILRERMHLLLLHISNAKIILEPSSEVKVSSETTSSTDLHQPIQAHETLKSCCMNKLVAPGTQKPLFSSSSISSDDPLVTCPTVTQVAISKFSDAPNSSVSDSCEMVKSTSTTSLSMIEVKSTSGGSRGSSLAQEGSGRSHKGRKVSGAQHNPPSRDTKSKFILNHKRGTTVPIKPDLKHPLNSNSSSKSNQSFKLSCSKRVKSNKSNMKLTELFKMLECGTLQVQCPSPSNCSMDQMTTLEELEKQLMSQPKNDSKVETKECQSENLNFPSERQKLQPLLSRSKTSIQPFDNFKCGKRSPGCKEICNKRNSSSFQLNRHYCWPGEPRRLCVMCKSGASPLAIDSLPFIEAKRARCPSHFLPSRCVSHSDIRINPVKNGNFSKRLLKNSQFKGILCGHQKSFYDMKKSLRAPFANENCNVGRECSFFHPLHYAEAFHSPVGWSLGNISELNRSLNLYSMPYPNVPMAQANVCDKYQRQSKYDYNYRLSHNLWGCGFNAL